MMEQAGENRGGEDLIAEELAPVDEGLIRGEDQPCSSILRRPLDSVCRHALPPLLRHH
jgi:hypothetical protein